MGSREGMHVLEDTRYLLFLQEIEPRSFGCSTSRLAGVVYVRDRVQKFPA